MDPESSNDTPALRALAESGIGYAVTRHGRVHSLAEAAQARGLPPRAIVKTMVVRRGADDHLFVLVPGDREISWPKLRAALGVNRISMPDADMAREVTGYERGTITPFGASGRWPVIADTTIRDLGTVAIGAGARGVNMHVNSGSLLRALDAAEGDVTNPADA
jgi:Cys-tRNA(Pro) deacylase